MGVERPPVYHSDGRLRGSYIYMLLCQDPPGPIYVKVGITDTPSKRLLALRNGCPVAPQRFAFCEVRSRNRALLVERELHYALRPWRAHGEWFSLTLEERPKFNAAWQPVLERQSETGWKLRWEQIAAKPFFRLADKRRQNFRRKFKQRGRSYQDFVRHSGSCK